jgi:hypothetical protein
MFLRIHRGAAAAAVFTALLFAGTLGRLAALPLLALRESTSASRHASAASAQRLRALLRWCVVPSRVFMREGERMFSRAGTAVCAPPPGGAIAEGHA